MAPPSVSSVPSLQEFLRLVRFEHALMLALAVLIAQIIVLGQLPPPGGLLALSLLVPLFSEMGSFALNDLLDIESDRLNKKTGRPLVRGTVSPHFAHRFSLFAFLVSVLAAVFINPAALVIAILFNLLAIAYNYKLKDLPLIGNLYIAASMAIPFLFGNVVVSSAWHPVILILAALGFLSGLGREIIKTVQDIRGDRKARGARTLPMFIGERNSLMLASALYLVFVPMAFLPFQYGLRSSVPALAIIAAADLVILYLAVSLLARKPGSSLFRKARNLSLLALFLGLIGYLVATLG